MINIPGITGFQWDEGNYEKNWIKHKVTTFEAEQIFFNNPLAIFDDSKHSNQESRHAALGKTDNCRLLLAIFTIRNSKIRVISARDMHNQERKLYNEKAKQENT